MWVVGGGAAHLLPLSSSINCLAPWLAIGPLGSALESSHSSGARSLSFQSSNALSFFPNSAVSLPPPLIS